MTSIALLILRGTIGGLLAGHGAQKLFGSFGGPGVEGTAGWLESMNLRPARQWAVVAGLSEFMGGMFTALGALNPLGPIIAMGSMLMATVKVHAGKPIWVTAGGAELPITNMAAQTALMIAGPGKLSFDGILGIRLPRWFALASLLGMIASVAVAAQMSETSEEGGATEQDQDAGQKLQAGEQERMEPDTGTPSSGSARPDLSANTPSDRPGVESWGSPDESELGENPVAAINREVD